MAGSEDELAQTESAPSSSAKPAPGLGETLGRYRIERTLGEGGMGVVHAAFDPDLERRVALKVLRTTDESGDARQRLLREARAMARLTHANVVTVHEVGSVAGRDYVAMELIEGETLADWLRSGTHSPHEIVAAFVAAGRGLAAAHAAGLVHRDFKPHNVLRRRDGRVAVTDFGLARGIEANIALETTMDIKSGRTSNTPSALSGITRTGSVLGTPAYMAPEQWQGGTVGPAADQFAFCVALWEALVGSRPYRGDTFDQLKEAVAAGPGDLDAAKLPRALRKPLLRGLDPHPDRRWPSMDALLAALVRAERRPAIALFAVGALVVAGAVVYLVVRPSSAAPTEPACPPPARAIATVWPADASKVMAAAGRGDLAAAFDRDISAWQVARAKACAAHDAPRLTCLDGVLARVDAVRKAVEKVTSDITDAAIDSLVDPSVCAVPMPPRLVVQSTPDTVAAYAFLLDSTNRDHKTTDAEIATFTLRPKVEPCARATALRALAIATNDVPRAKQAGLDAIAAAEACGDDRLRADALLEEVDYEIETPIAGPRGHAALQRVKVAIDRVAQPDLVAAFDDERAGIAAQEEHWDEAFAAAGSAIAGFGMRHRPKMQIRSAEKEHWLRFERNGPGDCEAIRASVAKWKPIAAQLHDEGMVRALETTDAYARLFLGDLEGAHPEIVRLWKPEHRASAPTQAVDGIVVNADGIPMTGVTVAAGIQVWTDSLGILPFGYLSGGTRLVTTDHEGKFTIADAPLTGVVFAEAEVHYRSLAVKIAPHVRLVLQHTRKLAGKVDKVDVTRTKSFVLGSVYDGPDPGGFLMVSPIRPDGTFSIDGVTTKSIKLGVATWGLMDNTSVNFVVVPAGADKLNLTLSAQSSDRMLDVIVRSQVATPLDSAQVFLMPGKIGIKTLGELYTNHHFTGLQVRFAKPIVGEAIPKAAVKARAGDLVAHFTNVRSGEISVCALGLNGDYNDPKFGRMMEEHSKELMVECVHPGTKDDAIVIETPPQKRFD